MATALKIDVFDFVRDFTEDREPAFGSNEPLLTSLKNMQGACSLLADDRRTCRVYAARPTQCRTYPFWAGNMIGEAEWKTEGVRCEGISKASAPLVPVNEIAMNLIISQIHARGVGENWTYDASRELLEETAAANPEIFAECIDEFSSSHHSKILYESELMRVVDSTVPAEEGEGEGGGVTAISRATRRLEFVDSPHVSQTEMLLLVGPSDDSCVDHTQLVMPVHRAMGVLALLAAKSIEEEKRCPRVWVLGAGGGALPSFLVSRAPDCRVDAVEPSLEVLKLAVDYFDLKVAGEGGLSESGIFTHAISGEAFVCAGSSPVGSVVPGPDVVIVDTCNAGTAPVLSMVQVYFLRALHARVAVSRDSSSSSSSSPAIVIINVLAPSQQQQHLSTLISNAALAGFTPQPIVLTVANCSNGVVVLWSAAAAAAGGARADALVDLLKLAANAQDVHVQRQPSETER